MMDSTYKRLYFKNAGRINSFDSSLMKTQWLWTRILLFHDKLLNAFNHIDFQFTKAVDLCLGDVIRIYIY